MNNKELIRCALMGDKQAQEECTAKGIALPCPLCRSTSIAKERHFGRCWYSCDACGASAGSRADAEQQKALKDWNARPAPPIGRCGECKNWNGGDCYRQELTKSDDFCSYFEPREE